MQRRYTVLSFECDENISEILIAELSYMGYDSFLMTEAGFDASITKEAFDKNALDQMLEVYRTTYTIHYLVGEEKEKNWNREWEKHFKPVVVDGQCLIRASFHSLKETYPIEIIINPKMAFGTGHHETTYLMIQNQLQTPHTNKTVLDAGCGTGILSVLAEKLGAKHIISYDVDHWAFENTLENAELNACRNIEVLEGDVGIVPEQTVFDMILANINLDVIIKDMNSYSKMLSPGGLLLLSGFLSSDLEFVNQKASSQGFSLLKKKARKKWLSLIYRKLSN